MKSIDYCNKNLINGFAYHYSNLVIIKQIIPLINNYISKIENINDLNKIIHIFLLQRDIFEEIYNDFIKNITYISDIKKLEEFYKIINNKYSPEYIITLLNIYLKKNINSEIINNHLADSLVINFTSVLFNNITKLIDHLSLQSNEIVKNSIIGHVKKYLNIEIQKELNNILTTTDHTLKQELEHKYNLIYKKYNDQNLIKIMMDCKNNLYNELNYELNEINEINPIAVEKLHVIAVISNPCLYKRRYVLMKEFIERMSKNNDIILYIVELAYHNQSFYITNSNNSHHLQLRTKNPLWHKENMINLGVKYLLPKNWKAFAWIDSDLEFDNKSWATDAVNILKDNKDVIQLFQTGNDLNRDGSIIKVVNSAGYFYSLNKPYCGNQGKDYWHPGYAWAISRKGYDTIKELFQYAIVGSGDVIMLKSILNKYNENSDYSEFKNPSLDFRNAVLNFQNKAKNLKLGYIPGNIYHSYHGTKECRKYTERHSILNKYNYSPSNHITFDEKGILVPTNACPESFLNEIHNYFCERKEDD